MSGVVVRGPSKQIETSVRVPQALGPGRRLDVEHPEDSHRAALVQAGGEGRCPREEGLDAGQVFKRQYHVVPHCKSQVHGVVVEGCSI